MRTAKHRIIIIWCFSLALFSNDALYLLNIHVLSFLIYVCFTLSNTVNFMAPMSGRRNLTGRQQRWYWYSSPGWTCFQHQGKFTYFYVYCYAYERLRFTILVSDDKKRVAISFDNCLRNWIATLLSGIEVSLWQIMNHGGVRSLCRSQMQNWTDAKIQGLRRFVSCFIILIRKKWRSVAPVLMMNEKKKQKEASRPRRTKLFKCYHFKCQLSYKKNIYCDATVRFSVFKS